MGPAGLASSERGANSGGDARGRDRRVDERFDMNHVTGSLVHKGSIIACEVLDISLSGCSLRTLEAFSAGALEPVKVTLPIHEMVLSIWGITQWTRWDRVIGIRFIHPTGRTRNQLAGLLTCLLDKSAAEVVKAAVAAAAAEADSPIIALEHPLPVEPEQVVAETVEEEFQEVVTATPVAPERPALQSEHKVLSMEEGESPAVLQLVADDSSFQGNVVDLGLDGCLMRLARPSAVRLNAQAEVDFHVRGLPFLLAGVTKEMHDKQTVEIRFTGLSKLLNSPGEISSLK